MLQRHDGTEEGRRGIASVLMRVYPPEALEILDDDWIGERRFSDALKTYALADKKYTSRTGSDSPRAVGVRARRAWCLAKTGKHAEAAELYRNALESKVRNGDRESPTPQAIRAYLTEARGLAQSLGSAPSQNGEPRSV